MGSSSHQIRQRDVTGWGIAALVCGSLAVLAGNLGGALPSTAVALLHGTRASGANFEQMQALLAQTRQQTAELSSQYRVFESRLDFMDRGTTEMIRRVAAVESSVPLLIEALPLSADIDRSLLTAAIGGDAGALREVEGGLMALSQRPLLAGDSTPSQPMPPQADSGSSETVAESLGIDPSTPAAASVRSGTPDELSSPTSSPAAAGVDPGITLGAVADEESAWMLWQELNETMGPLLLGLEPRLAPGVDTSRLVAGPFVSNAAASAVCDRLQLVGHACELAGFEGISLSAAP